MRDGGLRLRHHFGDTNKDLEVVRMDWRKVSRMREGAYQGG